MTNDQAIEECAAYRGLLQAVEKDEAGDGSRRAHDYRAKLQWIVDRARHYAEKTGLSAADILHAWESRRTYWYMNYYQDGSQPEIKAESVRVFETTEDLTAAIGTAGFRCPHCNKVSKSPYECDSGALVELINSEGKKKPCNWKVYGLFGHMGKGVHVFVKQECRGENIFMPVAWEETTVAAS